ncbi:tetratricopeptide repeat protein [Paraburkholderia sp. GAS38]|uniref:tetratricopeptide repeat protein n=1 Tax=Paraburkholderia sp. GAS38 TaxID=3035133 RepID=UPI003D22ECCF
MAAESGDVDAQFNLGWCYGSGNGVRRSGVDAARWLQRAARQGHAEAHLILERHYWSGGGPTGSWVDGISWNAPGTE